MNLKDALEALTVHQLKERAELLPGKIRCKRKAEWVDAIAAPLKGPWLAELVESFDPLQRAAVAHMVYDEWKHFDASRFHAIHGDNANWGERSTWYGWKSRSKLWLLFYDNAIPANLHQRLRSLIEPPPAQELASDDTWPDQITVEWTSYNGESGADHAPITFRSSEPIALHEVGQVLRLAQQGKLRWTSKTMLPTAATIKKVAGQLAAPDFLQDPLEWGDVEERGVEQDDMAVDGMRAFAWPQLMLSAKLVALTGSKGALSSRGQKALTQSSHELIRELWRAWVSKKNTFDELSRITSIKGQSGKGKRALTAPDSRRSVIQDVLKRCPPGRWVGVAELLRYMMATAHTPDVVRDHDRLWDLYVEDRRYGALGQVGGTWDLLEGSYVRCFLFEFAATLGLVDVAYGPPDMAGTQASLHYETDTPYLSPYDGLQAIRVTSLGAWVLGLTETYTSHTPRAHSTLKVLPNGDVVLLGTPDPMVKLLLDTYAETSSAGTWALERARLLEAVELGHPIEALNDFLKANADDPLPQTVEVLFKDVQRRSSLIREEGRASLLHVSEPMIAVEIAHHPQTRSLCKLAGEQHLVVLESDEAAFRRALRGLGYITALK